MLVLFQWKLYLALKNYYVFMLTLESPRLPINYTLYQQRFDINSESTNRIKFDVYLLLS